MIKIIEKYIAQRYSVIPEKNQRPAFKGGWKNYQLNLPSDSEIEEWSDLDFTGIGLVLGEVSGIVALDLDTDSPEILDQIKHILPESPVEKFGSKGWTRFFKYSPQIQTQSVKVGEKVILEVLSQGRKTTIPPSIHPNGSSYVWTRKELLDINKNDLPVLPPALIPTINMILSQKFPKEVGKKVVTGRNQALSSYLGNLLNEPHTVDSIISDLLKYDKENNTPPYFTDSNEGHQTTSGVTNALDFYLSHLKTVNNKAFRDNKTYIEPILKSNVTEEAKPEKKPESRLNLKSHEFIPADSAVKIMFDNIMLNSYVPQPELAIGAILATGAILASRKFSFQGVGSNLYISGVAPSGQGKNMGLEFTKMLLSNVGGKHLLGAGDMGSDAGITDHLQSRPSQLYIMDEIGGILKVINNGDSTYNAKSSDILAELYTTSTSYYLGRALKDRVVGNSTRPHLSILGATTPTGFREGVSKESLDKGLMGRFLLFFGESGVPARRVKKHIPLPQNLLDRLRWIVSYKAPPSNILINDIPQEVVELETTEDADKLLDTYFNELDELRLKYTNSLVSPIAARLYQQMLKIVMIHAVLNTNKEVPIINTVDVNFGYNIIKANFLKMEQELEGLVFSSQIEKLRGDVVAALKEGPLPKKELVKRTKHLTANKRNAILEELIEAEVVEMYVEDNQKRTIFYKLLKEVV